MSIQASRTVVGVIIVAVILAIFWYMKRDTSYVDIASFDECVGAGYAVIAGSPERCETPDGRIFIRSNATSSPPTSSTSSPSNGNSNLIRVTNITANQKITSPLTVEGEARGNWYFEASFPVRLLDGKGNMIAQVPAQAIGEWMTTEFVPFKVTLTFAKPATATGTLILHNDNPSGLPENDRFISIPVRF